MKERERERSIDRETVKFSWVLWTWVIFILAGEIVTFVMASVVQLTTNTKHHIFNTNNIHHDCIELFNHENDHFIEETLDLLFDSEDSYNFEYDLKSNILNSIKFPDFDTEKDTTSDYLDFESDESFDTDFVLPIRCGRKRKLCEMEPQKKTSEKSGILFLLVKNTNF